ncbi:hypothetical protein ACIO6T_44790 [Streptomyces sp. NPDC087532]
MSDALSAPQIAKGHSHVGPFGRWPDDSEDEEQGEPDVGFETRDTVR